MYCTKCGKQLPNSSAFCACCGEKQNNQSQSWTLPEPKTTASNSLSANPVKKPGYMLIALLIVGGVICIGLFISKISSPARLAEETVATAGYGATITPELTFYVGGADPNRLIEYDSEEAAMAVIQGYADMEEEVAGDGRYGYLP